MIINKLSLYTMISFCSFACISFPSQSLAQEQQNSVSAFSGFYLGGFGGWESSNDFKVRQSGVAFFSVENFDNGIGSLRYPLGIDATGDESISRGFGGVHLGYEKIIPLYKEDTTWSVTPAVELEGLYFSNTSNVEVDNSNPILTEHNFIDEFPMKTGVVLVNGVFTLNCARMNMLRPYIGIGLGAAVTSITGADSTQTSPPEPNVNHFNSDENSQDWTFAAQAKAGLRYSFNNHWRIFAEYRFLYLGNTEYTFGSTEYPTHVQTTSWEVDFDNMYFNAGSLGIEFVV